MEYKNIDILKSKTNISTLKQQIFDSERFISNTYFQEINNNWKSKSRHNFQNNLTLFINELKEFDKLMSETTITLDDIQKIQQLQRDNEILLSENKMLENSLNPADRIKVLNNNEIIKNNTTIINNLETKIINNWGGVNGQ